MLHLQKKGWDMELALQSNAVDNTQIIRQLGFASSAHTLSAVMCLGNDSQTSQSQDTAKK